MSTIRSSSWKTDAIVVVPESILLSFVILLLLQKFGYSGEKMYTLALLAISSCSMLLSLSAYLVAKKSTDQEDIIRESEKMRALGIPPTIIEHAAADAAVDAQQWRNMVVMHMGNHKPIASRPWNVFIRTVLLSFFSGTLLLVPFLIKGTTATQWHYMFVIATITMVGIGKYAITNRRPLFIGALRLLIQALLLYCLVEIIYYLVNK